MFGLYLIIIFIFTAYLAAFILYKIIPRERRLIVRKFHFYTLLSFLDRKLFHCQVNLWLEENIFCKEFYKKFLEKIAFIRTFTRKIKIFNKKEIHLYALILFFAMLISSPMIEHFYQDYKSKKFLKSKPFAEIIRRYHPDLYQDLWATIKRRQQMNSNDALDNALEESLKELNIRWIRALPNSSTDAIMNFLRYRYREAEILGKEHDNLCKRISEPNKYNFSAEQMTLMKENPENISEAMQAVFATSQMQFSIPYSDRRFAHRENNKILNKLNQELEQAAAPFADYYGCEFQKAYYISLLEYSDTDIAKILRWTISREIETYDKQQAKNKEEK